MGQLRTSVSAAPPKATMLRHCASSFRRSGYCRFSSRFMFCWNFFMSKTWKKGKIIVLMVSGGGATSIPIRGKIVGGGGKYNFGCYRVRRRSPFHQSGQIYNTFFSGMPPGRSPIMRSRRLIIVLSCIPDMIFGTEKFWTENIRRRSRAGQPSSQKRR